MPLMLPTLLSDRRKRLELCHAADADVGPVRHLVTKIRAVAHRRPSKDIVVTNDAMIDGAAEQRARLRVPCLDEQGRLTCLPGERVGPSGGVGLGRLYLDVQHASL